jgi:hypothetical protein
MRPRSGFSLSTARKATGSSATSRETWPRRESSPTTSVGGAIDKTVNTTTRAFAVPAKRSTASAHWTRSSGSLPASGTATFSSSSSLASTSWRSSDGTTIAYAVPSAPATIAPNATASRTRIPPGTFTQA